MASFIFDNRHSLGERHYVRKAGTKHYWFDFHANKMEAYRTRYNDEFCLVLFGSETQDDAYVMPYRSVQDVFDPSRVDHRGRWIGTIVNDLLRSTTSKRSMAISGYYNQFRLLGESANRESTSEPEVLQSVHDQVGAKDVKARICAFNAQFRDVAPYQRLAISHSIARPGLIATYLKRLRSYRCQLCQTDGFTQKNGNRYAEAYHIIELHRLIPGSYCSDNLVVVCPTCRKRLQYADVTYELIDETRVRVAINGEAFEFERNIITEDHS